jgi:ribosomal protein S18 acetylase RimI-like enzyme
MLIREATINDLSDLTELLCRAFDRGPLINWIVRQDQKRAEAMRIYFDFALREAMRCQQTILTTEDLQGVAIWFLIHSQLQYSDLSHETRRHDMFERVVGRKEIAAVLDGLEKVSRQQKHADIHLSILAVAPGHQRKGIGSALLQPLTAECDSLDTGNPANVPFYERHGFRVVREVKVSPNGLTVSLMSRTSVINRAAPGETT